MSTTEERGTDPAEWGPLVLHIRRLRQWHGEDGLSQRDLAEIAGVSARHLRSYEACRVLPSPIRFLLAVSLALRVPLEWLLDPRLIEETREQVEERRAEVEARGRGAEPLPLYED